MNNQTNQTSAPKPRLEPNQSSDQKFKITHWLGLYESHLFVNSPYSTYERYSRVLSRFYAHFPDKQFTYEFLRPDFEDYKQERLNEGASVTTVNIELTVLRGFWRFMLRMEADGVMLNPVRGVRVKRPSKKRRLINWPDGGRDEATESPA
jgi:site-specific recombinase XerD